MAVAAAVVELGDGVDVEAGGAVVFDADEVFVTRVDSEVGAMVVEVGGVVVFDADEVFVTTGAMEVDAWVSEDVDVAVLDVLDFAVLADVADFVVGEDAMELAFEEETTSLALCVGECAGAEDVFNSADVEIVED